MIALNDGGAGGFVGTGEDDNGLDGGDDHGRESTKGWLSMDGEAVNPGMGRRKFFMGYGRRYCEALGKR